MVEFYFVQIFLHSLCFNVHVLMHVYDALL